jgi:hypothetical protein
MDDLISKEKTRYDIAMLIMNNNSLIDTWLANCIDDVIDEQPTIEAEPLTDKEQRIFLAAMAREEKVCKEVDEGCRNCREPYEDSLVKICHEITRKVKGVLWI